MPADAAWLRSKADTARARAEEAAERGDIPEAKKRWTECLFWTAALEELHRGEKDRSLSVAMEQQVVAARRDRRGRPIASKHPFPAAIDAAGGTVEGWARDHSVNVKTVKAWYSKGEAGRRIPKAMAEAIERELGVPATVAIWRNGIR